MSDSGCPSCQWYKYCNDCAKKNVEPKSTNILNSKAAKTIGIMALGGVGTVGLATVALPAAGFTAGGIAAGSIAASIQSSIGAVGAGSLFAALQSAGSIGFAAGTQAIIGGVGAVGAGLLSKVTKKDKRKVEIVVIDETECKRIDTNNYAQWNTEQLIRWILSIEEQMFLIYAQTLRESLTKEQVDGSCLNDTDINDIKRWGISYFKHTKKLMKRIQELIENNDGEDPPKAYV